MRINPHIIIYSKALMAGCVVSTLRRKPPLSPVRAARQLVMLVATAATFFSTAQPSAPMSAPMSASNPAPMSASNPASNLASNPASNLTSNPASNIAPNIAPNPASNIAPNSASMSAPNSASMSAPNPASRASRASLKIPHLNLNTNPPSPVVVVPKKIPVRGIAPYISPRSKQNNRNSYSIFRSNSHSSHGSGKIKSPINRSRSPSGNSSKHSRRTNKPEFNQHELTAAFSIQPSLLTSSVNENIKEAGLNNDQIYFPLRRKSTSMKTEQSGSVHPSSEDSCSTTESNRRPNSASPRLSPYEISGDSYHTSSSNIFISTQNNDAYIKSVMSTPETSKSNSRQNSYKAYDTILISKPNKSSPLFAQLSQHLDKNNDSPDNNSPDNNFLDNNSQHNNSQHNIIIPLQESKPESPLNNKSRMKPQPASFEKIRDLDDNSPRAHSARETNARDLRRSKELASARRQESLNIHARKLRVDHLREMLNRERGLVDNLIVEFLY